jgi:predicted RNase H-like HicB family nuclease
MMSYRYLVVFEKEGSSYGAFIPDLPGCVAVGKTLATVKRRIREAMAMHIEDLRARGQRVPKPHAEADIVEARVA